MSKKINPEKNNNDINDFDKNVFDKYSKELLDKLEKYRIKSLKTMFRNEIIVIAICFICCFFDFNFENIIEYHINDIKIFAILCLIFLIVYGSTQIKYPKKTKSKRKNNFITKSIPKLIGLTFLIAISLCFIIWTESATVYFAALNKYFYSVLIIWIICYPFSKASEFEEEEKLTKAKIFDNFSNITYASENKLFTNHELKESHIFANFEMQEIHTPEQDIKPVAADDTFLGHYKGVDFLIEEAKLIKAVVTGYNTKKRDCHIYPLYWQMPVFKGIIIGFQFNKKIKSKTLFCTKKDIYTRNNIFAPYLKALVIYLLIFLSFLYCCLDPHPNSILYKFVVGVLGLVVIYAAASFLCFVPNSIFTLLKSLKNSFDKKKLKLEKVILEDVKWASRFEAYSQDQVEARYLLTTAFMERFLNLTTAFGTNKAKCSFCDDKMIIAISTRKNLFEFGHLFKKVDGKDFYNELSSVLELIEYFKLNVYTGL